MAIVVPFSDEQSRALVNLEQRYLTWMTAERELAALPFDLRRKTIAGRVYLYEIADRGGNGHSLGPWSAEHAARFADYRARKADAKQRREAGRIATAEAARLCRALRTPMLAAPAAEILREADRRGLLDERLRVVGTNALCAYAIEAAGFIRGAPDETEDFDLAWAGATAPDEPVLLPLLKAVDPTFTVNMERTFQARNARAYAVEIVVAPSRAKGVARLDQPRPMLLPEQEWLLLGRPVDRVVVARDGSAARIVAPDPRWFALHKLWLASQAGRHPLKRAKDTKQGAALLSAVREAMPQYPLDKAFAAALPEELAAPYRAWAAASPGR